MTINSTVMRAINAVRSLLGKSSITGNLNVDEVYINLTGTTQSGDKLVIGSYTFEGMATGAHKDETMVIVDDVTDTFASSSMKFIRGEIESTTIGSWLINGVDYGQTSLLSNIIVMLMSADAVPSSVAVSYSITLTE